MTGNHRDPTIDVGEVQARPIQWLWEGRIPRRKVTLVGGMPKVGKSLFSYYLASTISNRGGGVILITCEDDIEDSIRPRLDAAKANLSAKRVRHWEYAYFPRDAGMLEDAIRRHGAELIIIDPLTNHLESGVNLGQVQSIRDGLRPLEAIAKSTGVAIVLVVHTIKSISPSAHPLQAFPGPQGGLAGLARAAFIFGKVPQRSGEDEYVLADIAPNYANTTPSVLFRLDEHPIGGIGDIAFLEMIGEEGDGIEDARIMLSTYKKDERESGESKLAKATEWLIGYLRTGPRPQSEIAEDSKIHSHSWRTIRRAAEDLGVVKSGGPGSTWALPDDFPLEEDNNGEGASDG